MEGRLLHNRYQLLEKIGDGGMSYVYKARCTLLDRIVAIKILKEEYANDKSFVSRFRSEAQAAARLSHPHIVNIYDVGEDNGLNFIVMEYVEGTNLKDLILTQGPLPPDEIIRISMMICDALSLAHDKGIIHRDIKSQNILLTNNGNAKVADFGIARLATNMTITYSGNMVGSVHYVSPEQARGEVVDKTADIYSLGCVMYEMACGRVPFEAESPVTVALKHLHEQPRPPSLINEAIPRSLEKVILTALEKNPRDRYQSAQEMKEALYAVYRGKQKGGFRKKADKTLIMDPVGKGEEIEVARKKRRISPMGYVIIFAALLGLVSGFLYGMRGSFFGQEVTVPNVVGMKVKEAVQELEDKGLKLKVINRMHSTDVEKDCIISQRPEANQKVKKGREIEVVLSLGAEKVTVPKVVGKTLEDASYLLKNEGLALGEVTKVSDPDVPEGFIVSQTPDEGQEVNIGTKVDVVVSAGSQIRQVTMPNLVGMYLSDARNALEGQGLAVGSVEREPSDKYFPGQVTAQGVPPGQQVEQGYQVSLKVSKGPGPVPKNAYIEFTMPPAGDYAILSVVLVDSKGRREIYNNPHLGGYVFSRQIEYYGKATVIFYVDGQEIQRQELE